MPLVLLVEDDPQVLVLRDSAGQTVSLDGQEYLVLREEDVLGVIESAAATPQLRQVA